MKTPIWNPPPDKVATAAITRFMALVNERHGKAFTGYHDLYRWSVTDSSTFWGDMWDFAGIIASRPYLQVIDDPTRFPGARWFPGATLNFAENLLRYRDERTAIVFKGEEGRTRRISYRELYQQAAQLAHALRTAGVVAGDRVAGYLPNLPETVIAMLAATSLGAVWSSCSPEFGVQGVLDRFGQIEPKVLFTASGYLHKGTHFPMLKRVSEIAEKIPSLEHVVVFPYPHREGGVTEIPRAVRYENFVSYQDAPDEIDFVQVPAGHPLYIMYSSGTTGAPKCMVQGVAGILVNQLKEHLLHVGLTRDDTILYVTTCGWMMWNWLVCALAVGATIVLYEGHPFHPAPDVLWQLAEEEQITVFGTSARYLASLERSGVRPASGHDLSRLRAILSTGSPLAEHTFHYVYREIGSQLQLSSISGGTDINGCFGIGSPVLPVYPGELQCRGLGMPVQVFDDSGNAVEGKAGELVCTGPTPSMPLFFWNDPDGSKYLKAYFEKFPGVWTHGDWCEITPTGGLIIYGRSDATLNPGGVRIGTAELYRLMETLPEVADSLAVGQRVEGDERVVLFVRLAEEAQFGPELEEKLRREIREKLSPRHVPAKIIPVSDIPYTVNMKKVELAVRNIIHGEPVTNREALINPQALELYRDLPDLKS
ncbi:acetoacetate--CoA ligase [Geomonas sp. RF6]|uniref:acetoacetate--CoA ligase n=1 Tax=Geomonas sp. RF6 TaxID=2897342 RepID=UPI001E54036A|nr:acetoacetate--CoA ligase [Geomonas sp. RF6]UFS70909.1 acetoacetate--CoA ligase [Geomonas sp. RF6]